MASESTIIVVKASGTVQIAGSLSRDGGPARGADAHDGEEHRIDEARPPRTNPPMAPIHVKRRHQIPRSRSGQNVEAAMANAHPTSTLMETFTWRPTVVITIPMAMAETRNALTPRPMMSCEIAPAMLISRPDEVERKAAKAPAATSAPVPTPRLPAAICGEQDEDDRVGLAGGVEAGRLDAAQDGEDRREDVEERQEEEHEGGGAAGGRSVAETFV